MYSRFEKKVWKSVSCIVFNSLEERSIKRWPRYSLIELWNFNRDFLAVDSSPSCRKGWFHILPFTQSSRVHGAQHRAWLIILGNDRFPIFIFKRITPGKQEEEGTRKRCVRVVRQFFWTGSTGRVAAALFFFLCGKGLHSVAAGHSGKRGHFTGLCVSIHLPWTRLTLKYTSLPRTYLEK